MCEERRGGRAVADRIARPLGRLAEHAGGEVLLGVLQLDLLDDRDSIVAHDRAAQLLLDEDAARFGTEGDPHRIGEDTGAARIFSRASERKKSCL